MMQLGSSPLISAVHFYFFRKIVFAHSSALHVKALTKIVQKKLERLDDAVAKLYDTMKS